MRGGGRDVWVLEVASSVLADDTHAHTRFDCGSAAAERVLAGAVLCC